MINSVNNRMFINSFTNYQSNKSVTNKGEIGKAEFSKHLTSVDNIERKKGLEELTRKFLESDSELGIPGKQRELLSQYYNLEDKDECFNQFANDYDMDNMNSKELALLECIIAHADFIDHEDKITYKLKVSVIGSMMRLDATDLQGITNEHEAWNYRGSMPRLLKRLYNASEMENKRSTLELIRMVEKMQSSRIR